MNSLSILLGMAIFALGYATAEFHRAYRRHKAHMAYRRVVNDMVRCGLVIMLDNGRYVANPDLTLEEAEAIALANGFDIS